LSHALESWSDARAVDGTTTIIQPVIAPIYDSKSAHEIVAMLAGSIDAGADSAVRATWQTSFGDDFNERWVRALHDGVVPDTAAKPLQVTAQNPEPPTAVPSSGDVDIVLRPDPTIWDGRFANVAWLQELPKPLTKVTWDNVIAVSPALAAAQSLSNGDVIE